MTRRLTALVIGNAKYKHVQKLKNPANDAADIALKLQVAGFDVDQCTDCSHLEMDKALRRFKISLKDNDVGLFFFAGHGLQIDGENYLTAVDTDASGEDEAKHSSLALNKVITAMEKSEALTSIIILDACRNNPFERGWDRSFQSRGLAPVYAPRGTLIAYATSPGQTADDGKGRNGAYTSALLKHISKPDLTIEAMFKCVRNTLSADTDGRQISWEHTSLSGEFYFNLSLSARIDLYSLEALSDKLFVLDYKRWSHRIIEELKSYTWPAQNPAIESITVDRANKASTDSLFVLGRNIYQAATGGSNKAKAFIDEFASRTVGMVPLKRKAILDGMLFEIFFDSSARLRRKFKLASFHRVFKLQQLKEFAESFNFISECLLPEVGHFHALPGKFNSITIDIQTTAGTVNKNILNSVFYGGKDILLIEDPDDAVSVGQEEIYDILSVRDFEEEIARRMVIPAHLLSINYLSELIGSKPKILVAPSWSLRKA